MSFRVERRFNLLILEEGEEYVADVSATMTLASGRVEGGREVGKGGEFNKGGWSLSLRCIRSFV